jgi:hypothetical protein
MRGSKLLHCFFVLTSLLTAVGIFFALSSKTPAQAKVHIAQTYMGPTEPIPGNPYLVRVELLVKDSPDAGGIQIESVTFAGRDIPLKPRDIFGKRGAASLQLPPGKYPLSWTVNRDKIIWPREVSYNQEVSLSPRDLWVQILIEGEHASIL